MSTVPFSNRRTKPLDASLAEKLPSNLDAEKNILGAILLDGKTPNAALKAAREEISPEDFFSPRGSAVSANGRIFRTMLFLDDTHQPIEIVSLIERLTANKELDDAGGMPYVQSLMDGMPRLSNVSYYARLVKEKSQLRQMMHLSNDLQQRIIAGDEKPEALFRDYSEHLTTLQKPKTSENPLITVSYKELLTLELPKADPLIDPLVTRAGTFMFFSWAGWGKSWIATYIAACLSAGTQQIFNGHSGSGGHWPMFGPIKSLYMYGEMHGERIRERLKLIAKGVGMNDEFENLIVASKDYQRIARAPRAAHGWRPSIARAADRKHVEERLFGEGIGFLVLDNISTLWSAAQEDQSNQVAILKDWFIDLNTRGITILFLQHAGKGGDFLGDSAQVHILDSYVQLEHAPDYRQADGLRVNLHIKKQREFGDPRWSVPFEAKLEIVDGSAQWLTRTAMASQKKAAYDLYCNGVPASEALKEFQGTVKRATLYRWFKEFKEKGTGANPTAEDDE